MMKANVAREAAPNTAPIATKANAPGDRFAAGRILSMATAKTPPHAALEMNMGASNPPEVPEPSEITNANALASMTTISTVRAKFGIQNIADGVAPRAQSPRHKGTDKPQVQRANGWPPKLIHRKL